MIELRDTHPGRGDSLAVVCARSADRSVDTPPFAIIADPDWVAIEEFAVAIG